MKEGKNEEGRTSFSWSILGSETAVKHCDRSFFEYHGTGIPMDTTDFWEVADLKNGEKKEIQIVFEGNLYKAYFRKDNFARTRLFWMMDLQRKLKRFSAVRPYMNAVYDKINDSLYVLRIKDEISLNEPAAPSLSDDLLRMIAKKKSTSAVKTKTISVLQKERNPYIAEYVKRRADGVCQLCGEVAPFMDKNGKPFLESHHIMWLSEGGPDSIENAVALCPNCHRKMHVLNDEKDVEYLTERVKETE